MHKTLKKLRAAVISSIVAAVSVVPAAIPSAVNVSAAPDSDNYAKLLQYSLYMYDANMCGTDVESSSGFSWRGNCHTGDAVTGGYHDCGDHVKFGITAGYSAATLGWSYYEYKDVFDELGQTGHLKLITDRFAQYFKDSTTLSGGTVTNLVYQIGNGDADHNSYWGPPEEQDQSSRTKYETSSGASDVAAEYAAALAQNYINFGNEEDLTYAKALFEFSTKYNKCATDGVTPFYTSESYEDDQSWAAGWLYLATNDPTYNTFLKNHQHDGNWVFCWNNVWMGASILNGEINGDWSIATKYLNSNTSSPNTYWVADGWGAARYNTALQLMGLVASKNGKGSYASWAKSQMGMILGENPKNVCLVVGFSDISAKYPHHEAASGLRGWGEYNAAGTTFGGKGYTLTGALEGGFSNSAFNYTDALNDITSSEVGIDYNASLVGAAAGLYAVYKTGSIDSTVNGVSRSIAYDNNTEPKVTTTADPLIPTTTTTTTTVVTTTTTTVPTEKRVEEVSIAKGQTEVAIKLNGAAEIEAVIEYTSGGNGNGAIDYTDSSGNYQQFGNYTFSGNSAGTYTVTESVKDISAQNDTVTFHIWWSDNNSTISSIKLIYNDPVTATSTTVTTKAPETTTEAETSTTTSTTTTTVKNPTGIYLGDANCDGKVNMADAVAVLQNLANSTKYQLSDRGEINADCDGDTGITGSDAIVILRVEAGEIEQSELPRK